MAELIHLDMQGDIAVITIDNPPVNPMSFAVCTGLAQRFAEVSKDDAVAGIVLTGAGRAFVAGADIREFGKPRPKDAPGLRDVAMQIENCDKPVVAAINGACAGGGLELALGCHFRLAAPKAQIGLPEVKLGLIPGAGGTQRLIRQIPLCRAKELMFAGDHISAEEAVAIGLANRVVPADELMPACKALADKIAAKSPLTLKLLKRPLANGADMSLPSALAHEQAMISLAMDSSDAHEGCSAFLEKRDAQFSGS